MVESDEDERGRSLFSETDNNRKRDVVNASETHDWCHSKHAASVMRDLTASALFRANKACDKEATAWTALSNTNI